MNKKGIGWLIVGAVVFVIIILAIVAIVAFNRMWESTQDFDFLSGLSNFGIFILAGIIIVVIIVVVACLIMKR